MFFYDCSFVTFCVASHQVILQKSEVESMVHSPGDYILLSADKYEIKVTVFSYGVFYCKLERKKENEHYHFWS